MRPDTFRGKDIFGCSKKLYPCVYLPEHPIAQKNGIAYIHRIIAYEAFGPSMRDKHIHHKDGNVWNWEPDNLEPMQGGEHVSFHNEGVSENRVCGNCAAPLVVRGVRNIGYSASYCGNACRGKANQKISWPDDATLRQMLTKDSCCVVARSLGVTDNAIYKRLKMGYYSKAH